ncbi:DegT/DnrJ/EryC1/StrS family aminotransferase [Acinetobacter nosocomialis]|uniref:DegT/DnrJ/EryC1/StrS family aminotransferase n=1 Tax=Acinetobacter nosocomialis TaxID=106654 RepID=UPI001F487437|nr:DegT/DnrJ/EryC1/StrS family aminotransferase [Acinetobacter nosocomialis]MCE7531658.1 DegT/DnrJ/EryC1/StrS family aminotransferase [Acinetobacter nosocomialis]
MKISKYNYVDQINDFIEELSHEFKEILLNGDFILGKKVEDFEVSLAKHLKAKYSLGLNSGTDALTLSLMTLGIGVGDEVITQANTFYATISSIINVGATPILIDADDDTFLIDIDKIEEKITSRTKAILPVHLYGKPTQMSKIMDIAKRHNLFVIEDNAQSFGAKTEGQFAGTIGDIGCLSFHPSKNLGAAGDGGAILTNNKGIYEDIKIRRSLGQISQNEHINLGINSKLDVIQALVLNKKINKIEVWTKQRNLIAEKYIKFLSKLPISFQSRSENETHVYNLFQVRTPLRDELEKHLLKDGIDVVVRYPTPIHLQKAFESLGYSKGSFPVAEALSNQLLALPIRPDLSDSEINYICSSIYSFFGEKL